MQYAFQLLVPATNFQASAYCVAVNDAVQQWVDDREKRSLPEVDGLRAMAFDKPDPTYESKFLPAVAMFAGLTDLPPDVLVAALQDATIPMARIFPDLKDPHYTIILTGLTREPVVVRGEINLAAVAA